MLLDPVVDVPLDLSARRIGGLHDASPRRLQLPSLSPHLVERRLQRGVEFRVVQSQTDLPCQLSEGTLFVFGEDFRPFGPLHHEYAE